MSNRGQAIAAGVAVFLIAVAPTGALLYSISTGAVGTASRLAIALPEFLIIAAAVGAVAQRLDRGLFVAAQQRSSVADAWVPFFLAASVTVVGAFVVPVAILALMVNSDRSLGDNTIFFYTVWTGAFLIVALVAYGLEWIAEATISEDDRPSPGSDSRS